MRKNTNRRAGDAAARQEIASGQNVVPANTANSHAAQAALWPIDQITIGERHRKDLGDIAELAASIAELGLLQRIGIRPDGLLIWGERRLRAAMLLGWTHIRVEVVDIDEVIRGEFAENVYQKSWTPSELVAIGRAVECTERERAKARMVAAHASPGKLPELEKGDARDKIAKRLGISGRTYEKAKAVVEAFEAEPEKFGPLIPELDRYRGVDRAYRALTTARDQQRVSSLKPRKGRYRTLILDPPWAYDNDWLGRGAPQYALMGREQALALPVAAWAEDECHLYLWATNANFPLAVECMAAWGFQHKSVLTWVKPPPFGLGKFFRGSTEHCLFGVRGQLMTRSTSIATHFEAPRGEHSEKPERFYEIVRETSYLPAGEAFQRKARAGFVNLFVGNEAPPADSAPAFLQREAVP